VLVLKMDEDTKTKITAIVTDMRAQGMSDADIGENLRSMDISPEDIASIMGTPATVAPPIEEPVAPASPVEEEHVERLHASVGELHEKQDMQTGDLSSIRDDLAAIRADLDEIKPLLSAIKRLNTSLMDVNKKMLVKYGSAKPAKKKPVKKKETLEEEFE